MSVSLNIRTRRAVAATYAGLAALVAGLCLWRIGVSPGTAPWLLPVAVAVTLACSLGMSGRIRLVGGTLEVGPIGLRRTVNLADLAAISVEVKRGSRREQHHTLWLEGKGTLEKRLGIALGFYPLDEVGLLVCQLADAAPGVRLDDGAQLLKGGRYPHTA